MKVFIDGGAHLGEALNALLDRREDMQGSDVHFYEPLPRYAPLLKQLGDERANQYKVHIHCAALWTNTSSAVLYESTGRWGDLASTLLEGTLETKGVCIDRCAPIQVRTVDINEVLDSFSHKDYIVMKLDVEGAEYYLLDRMLNTGSIEMLRELYIEYHPDFYPELDKSLGKRCRERLAATNVVVFDDWCNEVLS